MTSLTLFFGDRERAFTLTAPMLAELERKTGKGIGRLSRDLMTTRDFSHADVTETIRLALVGGGEEPQRATELVETYVNGSPLAGSYALAVAVIDGLWNGAPRPPPEIVIPVAPEPAQ